MLRSTFAQQADPTLSAARTRGGVLQHVSGAVSCQPGCPARNRYPVPNTGDQPVPEMGRVHPGGTRRMTRRARQAIFPKGKTQQVVAIVTGMLSALPWADSLR